MARDPTRAARVRLAVRFAALVLGLLVSGGCAVYAYVRHALLDAFDTTHDLAIQSMLESVDQRSAALSVNAEEFHEEFRELNLTLGVMAVTLWDAQGHELARDSAHGPASLPAIGPRRETRGEGLRMVVVRREPLGEGGRSGVLVISRRAGDIAHDLASLQRALWLIVPLTALGALAIGWSMAGRALRPVQRAFHRQRAFMADASHELRTPLAVIRAQADVQLDANDAPRMRAAFGVIARTVAHLGRLVDDLLFLSRADDGELVLHRLPFALDSLVEEALEAFEPIALAKGSQLTLVAPPEGIDVEADPAQIQRLVAILLDNALRHGDPGPIKVSLERVGREVQLCTEDSGPGIAPALLPRAFERFVRGDQASRKGAEGHGLGLAIARSIVQVHQGTITLGRSRLGGTQVTVVLPTKG